MRELEYPFDSAFLLKKRKALKRQLSEEKRDWLDKRIAILGGSTTHDIRDMLELFLLNQGIRPTFYESEYAQYWQDAMFPNPTLEDFRPDLIYIHTSLRNLTAFPALTDSPERVEELLNAEYARFEGMWERLGKVYACPIIQNNFEYPFWRLMGNRDGWDLHGRVNFVTRLNLRLAQYAQTHEGFYLHDLCYLAADYGLEAWSDPFYWHMYKYALAVPAIPRLAHSVSNIIKSLFGKNRKAFALDLDNTLWGGVIGDDGVEGIQVGQETSLGQVYSEFQDYLKAHKALGVILNIISKNDPENALAGLNHPEEILRPEDFILIKANWDPKSQNLTDMAHELSLLPEAFVFVDDNPAEREIVRQQVPGACVPEVGDKPERFIGILDRSGFFEVTTLTGDDLQRGEMYKDNAARSRLQASFADYGEYLRSLEMKASIRPFQEPYLQRIAQLTNKSNQFNLTTLRCTQEEIEAMAADPDCITLAGKLDDRFGTNGVVALTAGRIQGDTCDITLWLMSCRVLKRDMEKAMLDELVRQCRARGLVRLRGHYYPTAKNGMVKDFYEAMGFTLLDTDDAGNKTYELSLAGYTPKNAYIEVTT